MSALQAKKRKEAEDALKQANKQLEKTMFRWQPDYLAAAPVLEKAADAFRAAGDLDMAKKIFAQAAAVQNKNKSAFRAAQNCESAAKVVVQQIKETRATGAVKDKYLDEMKKSYESACSYYSDMGELGKAADALLKGANACEENGMNDVRELYMRACSLMEAQAKPHFAVDVFRKTLAYLVKNGLYQESVLLLERQIVIFHEIDQLTNVHKCYLTEIVLLLVIGDVAAADKAYMAQLQSDAYLKSDECALAEDLVRAFKQGNEDLLQQTIRKQGFSFLDNQVGRLVRKLSIFGGAGGASASSAASSRTDSRSGTGGSSSQTQSRTGSGENPFAASAHAKDRYAPLPSGSRSGASASTPVRAAPPPTNEYENPPPRSALRPPAQQPSENSAFGEFNATTDSMASMTVVSEDDRKATDFDFDALEFSTERASTVAGAHEDDHDIPAPTVAQKEEETFDLT